MQNAIYLRKSRADQGTVEDTLRKHKETLLDYAAKHNIFVSLNDIYEEVISGESLYARPQMLRLLSDVEAGKFPPFYAWTSTAWGAAACLTRGLF